MGKIIIMIIVVNSFEFENMLYLFSMSLPQKNCVTENFEISP